MTNQEAALIWTADVLNRLYEAWPMRISLTLEQTLAATEARLPDGEQKVWCDLWLWLVEEGLVRIAAEQLEQLSSHRPTSDQQPIVMAVLTDKGLDTLRTVGKPETNGDGQDFIPEQPRGKIENVRRTYDREARIVTIRKLAFRLISWSCAFILLLNVYLFLKDEAAFYWSEPEIRPSETNSAAYWRVTICHYYVPFRTFSVVYEPFTIRACPRTMPINSGLSMKQL